MNAKLVSGLMGKALRMARVRKNLSVGEVAAAAVCSTQVLNKWEDAENLPQVSKLIDVMEAIGIDFIQLQLLMNELELEQRIVRSLRG